MLLLTYWLLSWLLRGKVIFYAPGLSLGFPLLFLPARSEREGSPPIPQMYKTKVITMCITLDEKHQAVLLNA